MAMRSSRTASGRSLSESGLAYGEKAFVALGQEMYREEVEVINASLPLVPVDTGALRGSAYAAEPERNGDHLTGEIGYGGVATKINPKTQEPTSAYALAVHENLQAHHTVGQAKYLSTPFDAAQDGLVPRLVAGVRSRLRGAPLDADNGQEGPE